MIVGNIIGGLGNQMFQYAFYKYLVLTKETDLKLDLASFDSYTLHNGYELEKVFRISEGIATRDDLVCYKTEYPLLFKIENKLLKKSIVFGTKHFKENNFHINNNIFDESISNFYVEGYFQTYRYIQILESEGKHLFRFETVLSDEEKGIFQGNCIAVHIRGGDYRSNAKDKKLFGGICTSEYYKQSIGYMKERVDNPKFIIFTDDVEYSKKILDDETFQIIDWNKDINSFRDMYLMSLCKHNIIANSSFSWWGAWLNNNDEKIVIAPDRWFNDKTIDQAHIVPPSWKRVSSK